MRQIIVDWTTPGGGGLSILSFDEGPEVEDQRAAIGAFLGQADEFLGSGVLWNVRTAGQEYDTETGTLTGAWSDATAHAGAGGSVNVPTYDAVQVLVQWLTGTVIGGRMLRGRTFLPGVNISGASGGNVGAGVRDSVQQGAALLIGADVGFGVWRRPHTPTPADPRPPYPGAFAVASASAVWIEAAVLRKRRQ